MLCIFPRCFGPCSEAATLEAIKGKLDPVENQEGMRKSFKNIIGKLKSNLMTSINSQKIKAINVHSFVLYCGVFHFLLYITNVFFFQVQMN